MPTVSTSPAAPSPLSPETLDALNRAELADLNGWLASVPAEDRVAWALAQSPGTHVLSSSFGAQSAVALHLLTQQRPTIPVVLVDTGYLFPETHRFIEDMTQRLDLHLRVYRSPVTPADQEAEHGRLWEQGLDGLRHYNQVRKMEPLQRALEDLQVGTWFTGLRRDQADSRRAIGFLELQGTRWKVNPIADWTDRDVWRYLKQHDLPYHPLWHEGYVSIGDTHTTWRWEPGLRVEDTRFFGLKRECGLHEAA